MNHDGFNGGNGRFPATRWSVIARVRCDDEVERKRALGTLCEAYWKPVYKYVRLRWNRAAADAQDLTQGFFARDVNSVIMFGLAVDFVLAFLVAYMQHDHYIAIILPGSIVGLIVGYATQKYGATPAVAR